MGSDKARLEVGGVPLAVRVARAMQEVAYPVLAVGPAAGTGLDTVTDRGEGPLAALIDGAVVLAMDRPILLLACDLPFVDADSLRAIAGALEKHDAVVPVVDGHDQPLAACYGLRAIAMAGLLVDDGRRAMHELLEAINVRRIPMEGRVLLDVDTPDELESARQILEASE